MTNKDEALKLALEALESDYTFVWPAMRRTEKTEKKRSEAVTAIKKALARPTVTTEKPSNHADFSENSAQNHAVYHHGQAASKQPKKETVAWYVDFGNEDEPNYACVGEKPDDEPTATVRPLGFLDVPEQEPVAVHRDLHSHMMIVAHRAADLVSRNGQKPTSQKELVRAICNAIEADGNLLKKLAPQPKEPEQESSALDLSQVSQITHTKAKTIAAGGDYAITGFVLTQKDGIKCIVDMDSVLWFDEPNSFRRILQSDTTSQKNDYRSIGIVYKTKDVCVGVIKESGMLIDGESIYAVSLPVQLNSRMASNKPNTG